MDVDILQSDEAIGKGYQGDVMVLEADGQVFYGADAWLKVMTIAPWYLRWLSWGRYTLPTRWLSRLVYGIVARIRYKLFGTRACPIPGAKPMPRP